MLLSLLWLAVAAQITAGDHLETLQYEPAVVRLTGTLTSGEGQTPDDKKITFPALRLSAPVRVVVDPDEVDPINEPEDDVVIVQLVMNNAQMREYTRLKGRRAVLTGTLFHQITAHHYAKVLMTVQKIELAR